MNLEARKKTEDRVNTLLDNLTKGEQAVLYKTLYALGFKIVDCDEIIRKEPALEGVGEPNNSQSRVTPQVYLPRGWPLLKT